MLHTLCLLQVLVQLPDPGPAPVRLGLPLPCAALAAGLHAEGRGGPRLQWRPLPVQPDPYHDRQWVELVVTGARGPVSVVAGGGPAGGAALCRYERHDVDAPLGRTLRESWTFVDGSADHRRTLTLRRDGDCDGEWFVAGERHCVANEAFAQRAWRAMPAASFWQRAGLLPAPDGLGGDLPERLLQAWRRLPELAGPHGNGDFTRSGEVVTNLEFDTVLALVRLGLHQGDGGVLAMAGRSARHLVDIDLDRGSALPFAHGLDHRSSPPQPGHVWLRGLILVALLTADDELLADARMIARGLCSQLPLGEGHDERLRDYGWPLWELEHAAVFFDDRQLTAMADRYADAIARRFDRQLGTWRFGEAEQRGGVHLERAWLTGGILLPALRAHLRRRDHAGLREQVAVVEAALRRQLRDCGRGVPTHWHCRGPQVFGVHHARQEPTIALLLDGLSGPGLRGLLAQAPVMRHLAELPRADDPDLATTFTLLARCDWVWR